VKERIVEVKVSNEGFVPTPRFTKKDFVRYVLVGSRAGVYGGPFDTTMAQHRLVPELMDYVVAGSFQDDTPALQIPTVYFHKVRHIFDRKDFLDVSSFEQIKSLWRVAGAGLVHISFSRGIGPMALLLFSRIRRAKIIVQTHGMLTSRASVYHTIIDFFVTRPLIGSKTTVIALTSVEEGDLINWFPKLAARIRIVGNPVSLEPSGLSDSPAEKSAVFIARLHPRKDVLSFGGAAKISEANRWKEKYEVLGPDEGELTALLNVTKGLSNFEYLGSTNQAGALDKLRSCGVFVLPSRDEPWGNVLVEAICLGKPVVVTGSSALAVLVKEYEAGVVVEDGDANAIAEAVHFLLCKDNYEIYSRNASRCGYTEFDNSIVKAKWTQIYKELT
jgi:glycosyltransferase involved in cell wall biosynthesis